MTASVTLTLQQMAAYDTLSRFMLGQTDSAMAVLRGAAGTGKTVLASHLVKAALNAGLTVAIAAPTNKAVRVLREKMIDAGVAMPGESLDSRFMSPEHPEPLSFGSIQGLLGMRLRDKDDGTQDCTPQRPSRLHRYDVAVVDECSMIGMDLFQAIAANKQRTRLLFVGDASQLPPIGAEETISPTFRYVSLDVSLNEIIRQQADNPVIALAHRIRLAIEAGAKIATPDMRAVLPPLDQHPAAAVVDGDAATIVQWMAAEVAAGRKARVVAYHDKTVQRYNAEIHQRLYGTTEFPFAVGQRVIVDQQCDAVPVSDNTGSEKLITSEEATVSALAWERHPRFPEMPACRVQLSRDGAGEVLVYVAQDPAALQRMIAACFAKHREMKAAANQARQAGLRAEAGALHDRAKAFSDSGWGLARGFAPLRHAYAMTSHKSQGSTFETVFVDFADFWRVTSPFTFNRSLYVAVTRPSRYLAIVSSMGAFA